jgi:hypothetical protein
MMFERTEQCRADLDAIKHLSTHSGECCALCSGRIPEDDLRDAGCGRGGHSRTPNGLAARTPIGLRLRLSGARLRLPGTRLRLSGTPAGTPPGTAVRPARERGAIVEVRTSVGKHNVMRACRQ